MPKFGTYLESTMAKQKKIKNTQKIKKMKKSIQSHSNLLLKVKNFWFGAQLFIVSVSLPVMCFVELSHKANVDQQEKVTNSSSNPSQVVDKQESVNVARLS